MSIRKELGKIQGVYFGHGGYQDACLGISFTLGGEGWGVGDSRTAWDANLIKCSDHCKWTEGDRDQQYAEIMRYISDLLRDAKVSKVEDLKGIPVEVTFDVMTLKEWRVLSEVL